MDSKNKILVFTLLVLASTVFSQQPVNATIEGYVTDANTGKSLPDVRVEVFHSQDHSTPVASATTDSKGFYRVEVPPGSYYDVYLRLSNINPNQRTPEPVQAGGVYTLNFNIAGESNYSSSIVEEYGFEAVVAVAVLIFALILLDQLSSLRKKQGPSLEELKKKRDTIQEMLDLAKSKYHKREIDEESFREISRDQQKKLIELESQIADIEEESSQ